ncbi:MAG: ABC transporter ATP-binding protein [Dehalococcoidia bacterium]|jgi:putative ABC transport system ATP-binding protein|nr:ABC transporter ATP-binding protein [Dehalococcoidia bacterium]
MNRPSSTGTNGRRVDGYSSGESRRLIELRGVARVYETVSGDFPALTDADLSVDTGEFVAIVGKSGSGKSTLLNMLTGIDRPTSGVIRVNGTGLNDLSENEIARWRGNNVGLVFQFQQLMPTLTVVENVVLPMDFTGSVRTRERFSRAMSLLELVDVADQADKFPAALSSGQQQRVAIARALANDPPFIAADEPTGNLDSHAADAVLGLFRDLAAGGKTVVIVTHERDIASRVDRVVTVSDGRVLGSDGDDSLAGEGVDASSRSETAGMAHV